MTQKEIQGLVLSCNDNGFALCKESKTGKKLPIREITHQEIMTILSMMYAKHITDNPGDRIMILPMDDQGNALAVTFAQLAGKKEVKE